MSMTIPSHRHDLPIGRLGSEALDVTAFAVLCETTTTLDDYPHAVAVEKRVPIYDGDQLRALLDDRADVGALLDEWARCLSSGPGALAIRRAYRESGAVDAMTAVFEQIIEAERAAGAAAADHFAAAGLNTRVWNVLQKSAIVDPDAFVRYYSNPLVALAAEAWLGPWYQITAQVNTVHPGGTAQHPHRDYHLGFQTDADAVRFPLHAHLLSQALTLQGAIAHTDMPIESGPTMLLPYSQRFLAGYLAWRDPRFAAYFAEHSVQLALRTGDAVFLNPGLHHAAGANRTTDFDRVANLLQISSVMGIAMEAIDRYAMAAAIYPSLLALTASGELDERHLLAAIAASADGYSFPSNLDTDPPSDGLAPETAQRLTARAVAERWPTEQYIAALDAHRARRLP